MAVVSTYFSHYLQASSRICWQDKHVIQRQAELDPFPCQCMWVELQTRQTSVCSLRVQWKRKQRARSQIISMVITSGVVPEVKVDSSTEGEQLLDRETEATADVELVLRDVSGEDVEIVSRMLKERDIISSLQNETAENIRILLGIGFDHGEVARMMIDHRPLLLYCGKERILPKAKLFVKYNGTMAEFRDTMYHRSLMLGWSNEQVKSVLKYLCEDMGVKQVGKVISRCPQLLGLLVPNLHGKKQFLESIGVREAGKALERAPKLLSYSTDTLTKKVDNLRKVLVMDDIGPMLQRLPQLLGMKIETIQSTHKWLVKQFGEEGASSMIMRQPAILQRKWENLEEKVGYLEDVLMRDVTDDLYRDPNVLTASLEHCMKPRLIALNGRGEGTRYSLSSMFSTSRDKFIKMTGLALPPSRRRKA